MPQKKRVLLGASIFYSGVDFKVLVAIVPIVKSEGFKEVVVSTTKIKK